MLVSTEIPLKSDIARVMQNIKPLIRGNLCLAEGKFNAGSHNVSLDTIQYLVGGEFVSKKAES